MAHNDAWDKPFSADDEGGSVQFRPPLKSDDEVDMTPMIDCVFLLLIFFLVSSIPDTNTAVKLPPARHGAAADPNIAVFVTVADAGINPDVYLADGKIGDPLPKDPKAQEAAIEKAIRDGHQNGKTNVIVKAEKSVKYKEILRISKASAKLEGMKLYLAIFEKK